MLPSNDSLGPFDGIRLVMAGSSQVIADVLKDAIAWLIAIPYEVDTWKYSAFNHKAEVPVTLVYT